MTVNEPKYIWAYSLTPRSTTTHLILHHSAGSGSAEQVHNYHKSLGWAGIAYHYYVRRDGSIWRGRPENMRGGHTTNWNWCSLGICFEGNFEEEQMSQAQLSAGRELVADIVRRYPTITVGVHSDYQQTACPGDNFPLCEILKTEPPGSAEDTKEPSPWAEEACRVMTQLGVFKGGGIGDFRWHDEITREETAVALYRFMEAVKSKEQKTEEE